MFELCRLSQSGRRLGIPLMAVALLAPLVLGATAGPARGQGAQGSGGQADTPEDLQIVDCLLPGQLRKLGRHATYMTARRPIKTTALDCRIRGGEYVAYDRASYGTALKVWLESAKSGDPEAQNYVGEIFEKGLGVEPDYSAAASWFRKAADQGYAPAQINLGFLYEQGLGVERDPAAALMWYRKAAGLEEGIALDPPASESRDHRPEADGQTVGPSIELIDPPLVVDSALGRALPRHPLPAGVRERVVVGRVTAPAGLLSLSVNERPVTPAANGIFRVSLPLVETRNLVTMVAVDDQGKRTETRFELVSEAVPAPPAAIPAIEFGTYHALIIGNDDYQHLPDLDTAINDATRLADLLERKYGFRTRVLRNAGRYQLLSALNQLRAELTEKDNLLVYYAGHGELDKAIQRGYWLPVDAERESNANWISTLEISDHLNVIPARHVLVVADSCYSGALTRSSLARLEAGMTHEARVNWLRKMVAKRSRTALTSGGLQPVLDGGGGGHSVFAKALLDVLETNSEVIVAQTIYREVSARVAYAADPVMEQVPEYAPIKYSGHEAGEFIFVPGSG